MILSVNVMLHHTSHNYVFISHNVTLCLKIVTLNRTKCGFIPQNYDLYM